MSPSAKTAVKRPQGGPVREPLSYILGTRAKVGCLRILSAIADPISQREVARRAGVQHRSARVAMDELVALGLVHRLEGGRDFLVSLNPHHHLTAALRELFRVESRYFVELRRELAERARRVPRPRAVRAVVLFGSVARGEDTPESDLDLLVITDDDVTRERVLERVTEEARGLWEAFGCRVRAIGYTLAEARRRWRRREPPLPEVARDGLVLVGPPLAELLGG
jgi:predicted nucleotidyltransferase